MKSFPKLLLTTAVLISGSLAQAEAKPSLEACLAKPERACISTFTDEFLARTKGINDASRQADMRYGMAVQLIQAKQFEQAEQIARTVTATKIRQPIFGTLASEYARTGDVENARRILNGITDPVITTIVLSAIAEVELTPDALDKSLQKAKTLQDDGLRFTAFDAIAKKLVSAGRLKDAENTAGLITYAPSRDFLFERIAQKLIEQDRFDEAFAIIGKIETVSGRIISLTELAHLFHSNGRPDLRGHLLDEAHNRISLIQPGDAKQLRARVMLAENLAEFGQFGRALAIADSLERGRDKVSVWLRAVYTLRETGDASGARKLYEKIKQAAASAQKPTDRSQILTLLITHLTRVGDIEDAIELTQKVEEPGRRARELREIGASRLKEGFMDEAEAIFRSIAQSDMRAKNLLKVARQLLKTGRQSDAINLAQEAAGTAAELTDEAARDDLNSLLAEFHMASGDVAEAQSALTTIANNYIRGSALSELARMAQTDEQKNSIHEALAAEITRMEKADKDEMVKSFLRMAKLPAPFVTGKDTAKLAALIHDETARGQFVTAAAYLLIDAGDYQQARRLVQTFADKQTRVEFSVAELSWLLRKATETPQ